ncbi:GlsB/YeaQ/YmgE family stress response membrane protein, partial [Mycolicibacterium sphagni]|nr:GlsB/YeaQ/YmgE family stress response membrane protein [Mycolicibacterium sphagni]
MTITGVITAILIGAVVGVLARLILPGKQAIGIVLTV